MIKDAPIALTEGKCVSGYYNGNRWPIQLVISKLNITLHLQPGDFILDKQGRKINDPLFETYAKSNQLSRELSDKPVPSVHVPVLAAGAPAAQDGQSVRSVTEFTLDTKGVKRPVIPPPVVLENQSVNKPSFVAMSMDEARRAGLIKKVREVPEDYGVPDNNSSTPPPAPPLRIAMDTDQPAKPVSNALPQRLQAALPRDQQQERQQMQAALAKGAQLTEALDSETGFLNVATQNIPASAGISAGKPAAQASGDDLPEPVMEDSLSQPVVDETLPAPLEDVEAETAVPEPLVKPVRVPPRVIQYACLECAAPFKLRNDLAAHARKKHPDKVNAILAAYPISS